MRLLLDTHAFIWLDIARNKLSPSAQRAIRDPENTIYLSLVSAWELQIKIQLNKFHLNTDLLTTISAQQETNNLQLLSLELYQYYRPR